MVHRDPQTGKFVSDDDATSWSDIKTMEGSLGVSIPAAELGGGTNSENITGDDAVVIDFDNALDNDEVYEVRRMQVTIAGSLPTTATAEGSGYLACGVSRDGNRAEAVQQTAPFYGGPTDYQVTDAASTVDVNGTKGLRPDDNETLWAGKVYLANSMNDTANSVAGGADNAEMNEQVAFHDELGAGPVFDANDELYTILELGYDNISDHAVVGHVGVVTQGVVHQLD